MRIITMLLGLLALTACAQENTNPAPEAEAAFAAYVAAINAGDTQAVAEMYDENPGFHWVERGGVQYTSGAQAAASLDSLFTDGGSAEMTVDNVQVAPLGQGGALVSAHFDLTMLDQAGDAQFAFDGWMTVGMVRRADGWKIAGGQTGPGVEAE